MAPSRTLAAQVTLMQTLENGCFRRGLEDQASQTLPPLNSSNFPLGIFPWPGSRCAVNQRTGYLRAIVRSAILRPSGPWLEAERASLHEGPEGSLFPQRSGPPSGMELTSLAASPRNSRAAASTFYPNVFLPSPKPLEDPEPQENTHGVPATAS